MYKYYVTLLCVILYNIQHVRAAYPVFENTYVLTLTDDTFEHTVSDRPVFLQFYAPWCGHCKAMAPAYNDAATVWHTQYFRHIHPDDTVQDAYAAGYKELNEHITYNTLKQEIVEPVLFAKIDCVANRITCSRFNIHSYPKMRLIVPYEHTLTQLRQQQAETHSTNHIDVYSIKKVVYNFEGPRSTSLFLKFIQNYKLTAAAVPFPYVTPSSDTKSTTTQQQSIVVQPKQNIVDRTMQYINNVGGDTGDRRFLVLVIGLFMVSFMCLLGLIVFAVIQYMKLDKQDKAT